MGFGLHACMHLRICCSRKCAEHMKSSETAITGRQGKRMQQRLTTYLAASLKHVCTHDFLFQTPGRVMSKWLL